MIDLKELLAEISRAHTENIPQEFAFAVLNDLLMSCQLSGLTIETWSTISSTNYLSLAETTLIQARDYSPPFSVEQLVYLAQIIKRTSLQNKIKQNFNINLFKKDSSLDIFKKILKGVRGLPVDQIIKSSIRQEEFFRNLFYFLNIPIINENIIESSNALAKLSYIKMLSDAERAETKLKEELKSREKMMKELQRQAQLRNSYRGSYE